MPRSVISVASLFLLHLADAQEKPSLYIPQYSEQVTYRQDVCGRHDSYYNGTLKLRDALQGFEIRPLIVASDYFRLDDDGAISEDDPGFVADILDEIAKRGGFTWRNSFGFTEGPGENHTWTELALWAVEAYDVSADWWIHSAERLKLGIGFPEGYVDASYILIAIQDEDNESSQRAHFWSWAKPFSRNLWFAIIITVFVSGFLFSIIESSHPEAKEWKFGSGFYGTILNTLQHYQMRPKTRAGKIITISVAFWSLLVTATYTANLASFFVVQNTPSSQIQTIDDAINAGKAMCVWGGIALEAFVLKHHPKGIYVPTEGATGHFEGLLEGKCSIALATVNEWERFEIDKNINGKCNLEWIGRIINFQEAGFAVKIDSGTMCTSLVKDVMNLHLVEMKLDGTMDLIKKSFLQKTQDVDCQAANALSSDDQESAGQLTLAQMAGTFVLHSIMTGLAIIVAAVVFFRNKRLQKSETNVNTSYRTNVNKSYHTKKGSVSSFFDEDQKQLTPPGEDDILSDVQSQLAGLRDILKAQADKQDHHAATQEELARNLEDFSKKQDKVLVHLSSLADTRTPPSGPSLKPKRVRKTKNRDP